MTDASTFPGTFSPDHPHNVEVGGKGRRLLELQQMGFRVPAFFVIPGHVLLAQLPTRTPQTRPATYRQQILEVEFSEDFRAELQAHLVQYGFTGKKVAVRSSAQSEDGTTHSFAGIFTTRLNVQYEDVEAAIREVWASVYAEPAQIYQEERGAAGGNQQMSVVVQEMVEVVAAGVAFGIDPVSGDRSARVISAVFGLGEGLVSGELDADRFVVREGKIESRLAKKTHAILQLPDGGTTKQYLPKEQWNRPSLNDVQIRELSTALNRLYRQEGFYQDIEFAVDEEGICYLQARPVSLAQLVADQKGWLAIWDNTNILESYPGLVYPLTYSFVRRTYEFGYLQLARLLVRGAGISQKVVDRNRPHFSNMVGLIEGRLYYNLMTYYHLFAMLPAFKYTSRFLEGVLGVSESFDYEVKKPAGKWKERRRLFLLGTRMLRRLFILPKTVRRFEAWYDQIHAEYAERNYDALSPHGLMLLYYKLEREVIGKWHAPVINGLFTMIFFAVLKSRIRKWIAPENPNLQNDLLIGEGNIISTAPVRWTLKIVEMIREDVSLLHLFRATPPDRIWQQLQQGTHPKVSAEIRAFLRDFGLRTIGGELKMETIPYQDHPPKFIKVLQSYLKGNQQILLAENDGTAREKAEEIARKALRGKPLKRWAFFKILNQTRDLVRNRENTRYTRTRAFSLARNIFVALGRKLSAEGVLADPRDIMFLDKDEVFDYIRGTSIDQNLQAMADRRKIEFSGYHDRIPEGRLLTRGIVYQHNDFFTPPATPGMAEDNDPDVLTGVGCCPGKVTARVRIVLSPAELDNVEGQILVAYSTDPGWVKLFPTAAAVAMQRGSLLSHTGIVTRELGIPCVVSVPRLLDKVRNGDLIELDGAAGTIRILEPSTSEQ